MLSEAEGYDLPRRHSIPFPDYKIVQSTDDARKAVNKIGYPVVIKIVSPQVVHKSDVGGVIFGSRTERESSELPEIQSLVNDYSKLENIVRSDKETRVMTEYEKLGVVQFDRKVAV